MSEPANVLYPEEFARRAGGLKRLGVLVDVLDVKDMKKTCRRDGRRGDRSYA